jgi:predicted O-linked N-acetylglucosamine transferase (SPINDLY family)
MAEVSLQHAFEIASGHQNAGRLREAEEICRQILAVQPGHLPSLQSLAFIAYQTGRPAAAIDFLKRAIEILPSDAGLYSNLGSALAAAGQPEEAVRAFERAMALKPDAPQVHSNLGNALAALGKSEEAIAAYRRALALNSDSADAHNNLGTVLNALGRRDEAILEFRRAVLLRPRFAQAWNNLGTAMREAGELDESVAACREALAADPQFLPAHHNLGNTLRDAGEIEQAIRHYRAATARDRNAAAASDLLLAMLLHPGLDAKVVWEEHKKWNDVYAKPLAPAKPVYDNDQSPSRRLRIGYVSPDFREHAVGRFFLPLLAYRDRIQFESLCYSDARQPDLLTEQIRGHADQWRNVHGIPDDQLAETIRQDRIDILVDLTMHTKNNRLLVFAREPAPVQVTYLAYPGTTGLGTMDWRLTDSRLDPTIGNEQFYSERSLRLRTFWCYQSPVHAPTVSELPAKSTGRITFGCLNLYSKVTPATVGLWADILREIPDSRMIVHSFRGSHRERSRDIFASHGIERHRLEFVDRVPPATYFARYHEIDIALDTHPYPGGTTTCDALWMGVPPG